MPYADTFAMQAHIEEISRHVRAGSHAVVLLDEAGWHPTDKLVEPANITLLHSPPKSPELNPPENIRPYPRQTRLSNRVFENDTEICDVCRDVWNKLIAETGRIASIGPSDWAAIGQSP
ncbi:MAG: transposase [Methylocella sp.]